jgi:hypothetical protein
MYGAAVALTHTLGHGFPDAVVALGGVVDLVEIKTPTGALTEKQATFIKHWRGWSEVWIIRTAADVLAHVADMRRRAGILYP